MTKQEILDGLEGLKDLVNHIGKSQIDALKAGVVGLEEPSYPVPLIAQYEQAVEVLKEAEKPKKAEPVKAVSHGTKRKR